ncbi:MAG TPA: ComGF family competence protein [Bacillota bacterium]|nr:ComGF family competence protein [Bacillota bacterium]
MVLKKSEYGFTFVSGLLGLMIVGIIIPIMAYLYQASATIPSYSEEISIQQFFQFLRDDLSKAVSYRVEDKRLYITLYDGEPTTIEKFDNMIRRQVKGTGHEIYLRDINDVLFEEIEYGIQTTITSSRGKEYVKHIVFYP